MVGENPGDAMADNHAAVRRAYDRLCLYTRTAEFQLRARILVRVAYQIEHDKDWWNESAQRGPIAAAWRARPPSKIVRGLIERMYEELREELQVRPPKKSLRQDAVLDHEMHRLGYLRTGEPEPLHQLP